MIVVAGGPTRHLDDRTVDAGSLVPLQGLGPDGFCKVVGFDVGAGVGVSNLALVGSDIWWSDGSDVRVGPEGLGVEVADLADVHELTAVNGRLALANTGRDEVVFVDPLARAETARERPGDGRLHLNQAFEGLDGRPFALVHHVHGRQLVNRVKGRLLKVQGDGGLIALDGHHPVPLRLTAPHSARLVGGEVWIADSGRARVVRYDEHWVEIGSFPTAGWGRGAVVADGFYWLGLSPLRPRYRGFVDGPAVDQPEVHVFDVRTQELVDRYSIDGIDQINGVDDLPLADDLLKMSRS